jgi:hypothetical protein
VLLSPPRIFLKSRAFLKRISAVSGKGENNISLIRGAEIIALVVEHGRRFPFLQWCAAPRRDLSRGAGIRSVRLLERVLSELASGYRADLRIEGFYSEGGEFPTLVDYVRLPDSATEGKSERHKVKLERGMPSLLDLLGHGRPAEGRKTARAGGPELKISFWESAGDRARLIRLVAEKGETGLKAIDRLRKKLLAESIEKGRWY